jgi:hypothetical protein
MIPNLSKGTEENHRKVTGDKINLLVIGRLGRLEVVNNNIISLKNIFTTFCIIPHDAKFHMQILFLHQLSYCFPFYIRIIPIKVVYFFKDRLSDFHIRAVNGINIISDPRTDRRY